MDTLFGGPYNFFATINGSEIMQFACQMPLIIFKLVFNTFIHKEDLLSKRILENHGFS